jgi:hypothetical protein
MTKSNAEKQRDYRNRRKTVTDPVTGNAVARTWNEAKDLAGLSGEGRSNYFSDPRAPGGWGEVIRLMSNTQAQAILDKVVTKRQVR